MDPMCSGIPYHSSQFPSAGPSSFPSTPLHSSRTTALSPVPDTEFGHYDNDDQQLHAQRMNEEDQDDMIWEPFISDSKQVHYLVLDSNILIGHLNMVRTLHNLLTSIHLPSLLIMVPSRVIQEIDGLQASMASLDPGSSETVGRSARTANTWLLDTHRKRRKGGLCAVRCQSLNERYNRAVVGGKGDDDILDCCLYFATLGAKVVLWTDDKNLSLKGEINSIQTMGCQSLSLSDILKGSEAEFPDDAWRQVYRLEGLADRSDHVLDGDVDMGMGDTLEAPIYHDNVDDRQETSLWKRSPKPRYFADLPQIITPLTKEIIQVHAPPQPDHRPRKYPYLPPDPDSLDIDQELESDDSFFPLTALATDRPLSALAKSPSPGHPFATPNPPTQQHSRLTLTSLRLSFLRPTVELLSHPTYGPRISCSPPPSTIPTPLVLPTLFTSLSSLDKNLAAHLPLDAPLRMSLMQAQSSVKTLQKYLEYHEDPNGGRGLRKVKSPEIVMGVQKIEQFLRQVGLTGWSGVEVLDELEGVD